MRRTLRLETSLNCTDRYARTARASARDYSPSIGLPGGRGTGPDVSGKSSQERLPAAAPTDLSPWPRPPTSVERWHRGALPPPALHHAGAMAGSDPGPPHENS